MRISDWSSDVCSSDLWPCLSAGRLRKAAAGQHPVALALFHLSARRAADHAAAATAAPGPRARRIKEKEPRCQRIAALGRQASWVRSEEHTSELQSLMRISYAVFCLKKKNKNITQNSTPIQTITITTNAQRHEEQ